MKDYSEIKRSESRYGMKDVGRRIAPERYEAFIDSEPRPPARMVTMADAMIEGAFNRE